MVFLALTAFGITLVIERDIGRRFVGAGETGGSAWNLQPAVHEQD